MSKPPTRQALAVPARVLAPRLLGAVLSSYVDGSVVSVRLTEVEAYEGAQDPASHAYRGPSPRTAVMFGPPGHLYCYFTYGMHWCANIVCGPGGTAAAVLLRAGEIIEGTDLARTRRPAARTAAELAKGPARLATALALDRETNGVDLLDPAAPVRLEHLPSRRPRGVETGPRIGISRAVDQPWRFWIAGDPSVSRPARPPISRTAARDPGFRPPPPAAPGG